MAVGNFRVALLLGCAALASALLASSAQAALVISTDATQNVSCSGGVCSATAADAVLNVNDVTTMLASAPLTIQSGSQARDILVEAPFSWTSNNALALAAANNTEIYQAVTVAGAGGLTIRTKNADPIGTFSVRGSGRVILSSTQNKLKIDGHEYELTDNLPSLAQLIAAKPARSYALINSYDASADGAYSISPVNEMDGSLEGLGNTISNLTIVSKGKRASVGLIGLNGGTVTNLRLERLKISARGAEAIAGGIAANNDGNIYFVHVSGTVVANSAAGGIAAANRGLIERSSAAVKTSATRDNSQVGGLVGVGDIYSTVDQSFAAGTAFSSGQFTEVGGLIGGNSGNISNSYAVGTANVLDQSYVGGFAGSSGFNKVTSSYSAGPVSGDETSKIGGFLGETSYKNDFQRCYWDKNTSGAKSGAGNTHVPKIVGLSDAQLKSGLPTGFDPNVWAQDPHINNGYPYLIANPPVK